MEAHPLRAARLRVFAEIDPAEGARGVFRGSFDGFPVIIPGDTVEEVKAKAEEFREGQLAKHEAEYEARMKSAERSRAYAAERKRKKEEGEVA